jgi:rifampicin phosphotransferase
MSTMNQAASMDERPSSDAPYVIPFAKLDRASLAVAGGKAANLGELTRAGFPVPPGFVVSTAAYRLAAEAAGVAELVAELAAIPGDQPERLHALAGRIRAAFQSVAVPAVVAEPLVAAYGELAGGKPAPVAVRSSATAEDLPTASFAGQQDTYLNVVGVEAVLDAVRRCWGSLWTDRAVSYRASNNIDHRAVTLAVVVQRMVEASVAGVMFTANPLTGRRHEAVIDASPGLGEAVVSGAVNPDHFVVDAVSGRILERRLGDKRILIRGRADGGTERVELPNGESKASLSDEQVRALAALGSRVERHYGAPQDTEFAVDHEGKLWLTQARPVTTLFPLPDNSLASTDELRVFFSANVAQGVFRPFTPMGIQIFRLFGAAVTGVLFGSVRDPLNGPPLFMEAAHRVFVDVTPALRSSIGRRVLVGIFSHMEARSGAIIRGLLEDPRLAPGSTNPIRFALGVGRVLARTRAPLRVARALTRPAAARSEADRAAASALRLGELAPDATPGQRLDAVQRMLLIGIPDVVPHYFPVFGSGFLATEIARRLLGDRVTSSELEVVRRGLPHNPTTEMDLSLWSLAQQIRADTASAQVLRESPPGDLARRFRERTLPGVLQQGLADFLKAYGHRGVAEIDVGVPRWSEDPTYILGVLANYLRLDDPTVAPDAQFRRAAQQADAMVAELARRARRKSRLRGLLVRFLLGRSRQVLGVRERPKFFFVEVLARARRHLQVVGEELARNGRLHAADDVFFLDVREVRDALAGADVRAMVAERRESYGRELSRKRVPRVLLSDGTEPTAESAPDEGDSDSLRGTPASSGTVTAGARVILDPTGARLEPGEILVAPSTDPGWTPLFLTAGGLVMEMGGAMSHGAVVAREYGIPAVVGVAGAVDQIVTGQEITVDGTAGIVRVE